jgi:hypothetical protein
MYRLLDTNEYYTDWQPEANIESVNNKLVCPFTLGQTLTFKPKSSKEDVNALPAFAK